MIIKEIICDVCGSSMSWDNAYPNGREKSYYIKLPGIQKDHICFRCADKMIRILKEHFKAGEL